MDIKDRLLMFINALDIKRSEFSKSIEITSGNLSDWLNRKKNSKPSASAMVRINECYGLNINWLLTGKGGMFILDVDGNLYGDVHKKKIEEVLGNNSVYHKKLDPFDSRNITLPIYGEISAGQPLECYDESPSKYIEIPKAYLSDSQDKYITLKINGRSMEPKIMHGDIVVIKESMDIPCLDGKISACQTPDGVTLKKLQFDNEKKRVILKPLNPDFDVIIIEEYELETFRILGEMVFLFRVV
jgi:SOS-response transcriptional repressor LexA